MRTEEEIRADADRSEETGHTFSNHTEFDIWADRYCYRCVHDDFNEKFCPILGVAMAGLGRPREWTRADVTTASGFTMNIIDTCTEFEERHDDGPGEPEPPQPEPEPDPVHPAQLDIIDAYIDMGGLDELINEAHAAETYKQGSLW